VFLLANDHLDFDFSVSVSPVADKADSPTAKVEPSRNPHRVLLDICAKCLETITSSLSIMPYGIRYIAGVLARLAANSATSRTSGILSDFLFLHWIVNAFWNPGDLSDVYPMSSSARSNLEAVGTVILKLMSGSRFSSFDNNLKSVCA
jgi:hypothetical protein